MATLNLFRTPGSFNGVNVGLTMTLSAKKTKTKSSAPEIVVELIDTILDRMPDASKKILFVGSGTLNT
jgi:hypothetical protein